MARKKENSNFEFVENSTLRENLDIVFDHIVELLSLSESSQYDRVLKSSFRKTTIIHTAAIIEGLLLYKLKKHKTVEECASFKTEFKIEQKLELDEERIVAVGKYKTTRDKFQFNKANLDQVNKLCKEFELISEDMFRNVDSVREQRNRQHVGGLQEIDYEYTKEELQYVFDVARDVKNQVREAI
jgi:hypothetical protein